PLSDVPLGGEASHHRAGADAAARPPCLALPSQSMPCRAQPARALSSHAMARSATPSRAQPWHTTLRLFDLNIVAAVAWTPGTEAHHRAGSLSGAPEVLEVHDVRGESNGNLHAPIAEDRSSPHDSGSLYLHRSSKSEVGIA